MGLHVRELALVAFVAGAPGLAVAADDWQAQVGEALGKTGATAPGGIYRVGLPRTDLKVTLDGVELKPGFALGGYLAFEKTGDQSMVMGDLVLTMDEVAPVMTKLAAGGIDVTALRKRGLILLEAGMIGRKVLAAHGDRRLQGRQCGCAVPKPELDRPF